MNTLEDIAAAFSNAAVLRPYAMGRRYPYSLIGRRLFLSRGPGAEYEVFVSGTQASFGAIPAAAAIEWGGYHEPGGAQIEALRFSLPDDSYNCRLISHLAYEAYQRLLSQPAITNADLLVDLAPYIGLVAERGLLSSQEQQGLLGELLLLERLIELCRSTNIPVANGLGAWKGWQKNASRDFSRNGIVVEVKATSKLVREHQISTLHQLELGPQERALFIYSVSVAQDASASLRLCDKVESIARSLGQEASAFDRQLLARGYDRRLVNAYALAPTFTTTHFTAALFEVDSALSRLRQSSFVGGSLPPNVRQVSYLLNLQGAVSQSNPRSPLVADQELTAMLM
jgi:hypothetical protein